MVPLLARGTQSALDALPVRFPSRVPSMHGLPELPDNLAEGIVLRPDTALSPEQRPIVKLKIEEFDEQRFGQSRPWDPQVRLPLADLRQIGGAMVNPARLASARSKVGPATPDELLDEVILDVMVELAGAENSSEPVTWPFVPQLDMTGIGGGATEVRLRSVEDRDLEVTGARAAQHRWCRGQPR